ncbi:anthrone oxygenase family protein [Georgenia subflava]|uniref:DUF1772 domain-containing protein n=1 Tax=Georgenia subflava TaxID=1622177 RepID=A0A6N7EI04_9MICO|nr:anthrone oxygenase family protein [Georgenia subflava]MPV36357.1 DUF1772 domain-containing protein [Georgenia subflava]
MTGESVLVAATAIGSATVGGVFFAFDAFVLHGLAALPAGRGAEAMRSVNVSAVRPGLMIALFGTAALSAGVVVLAARSDDGVRAALLAGGAGAYLLGTVGTTIVRDVPLNDALGAQRDASVWADYVSRWGRANRVRTVAALVAATALTAALGR